MQNVKASFRLCCKVLDDWRCEAIGVEVFAHGNRICCVEVSAGRRASAEMNQLDRPWMMACTKSSHLFCKECGRGALTLA